MSVVAVFVGLLLGVITVWIPSMQLAGYLAASHFGAPALISCFAAQLTIGTIRDMLTPQLTGNTELLSVWSSGFQLSFAQVFAFAKGRIFCLVAGLLTGGLLAVVGFDGAPPALSWLLVLFVTYCSIGGSLSGWLVLLGIGLFIQVLGGLGVTNAVIAVMTTLSLVQANLEPTEQKLRLEALPVTSARVSFLGVLAGLVPGLSAQSLLTGFSNKSPVYTETMLAGAVAEGVTLGVFFWQRPTSKSTLTTFLSQFTSGEQLNGWWLAGILMLSIWACFMLTPVWVWLWNQVATEKYGRVEWALVQLVPVVTSFYFFGLGGVIWAALTYGFARLVFVPMIEAGVIPDEVRPLVASVPLLLG